ADRGKAALVVPGGRSLSWRDLEALVGRLANVLLGRGLRPGDRVAAQIEKSAEAVALYLACLKASLVYLPLNTAYTPSEIAYFLDDAEPGLFVCDGVRSPTVPTLTLAELLAADASAEGPIHPARADDLAALCYTSGTTGRSKGAMLTHRNLSSNAETLVKLWGFVPGDVLLHALPIFHVHGLFVALHTALLNGSTLLFLPKFDAGQVLELMPQASVMMGVPTFYTRLLDEPGLTAERCRHMRLFVSGSAPLLAETHKAFEARTGQAILERYGMTETGMLASNPLHGPRRAGTVGRPLPDVELRIADESGRALPQGEVGSVEVRGPNVFPGYWRRPEQRAKDFRPDGFFITGDIGVIEPDGYLALVGRAKDLIISGGYNVYPKEIELVLDAIPGIGESAVVGLPHRDFGEGVTAFCTVSGQAPVEAAVIAECRRALAAYKVPKRVLFLDSLPRNAMGKVQKAKLREQHSGLYAR
ncbi:MAG TPA: AMP-binding protein, partial [Kiloniellales bacterium]|nr:AMP-binding protein [Kiloniellales bacterium]